MNGVSYARISRYVFDGGTNTTWSDRTNTRHPHGQRIPMGSTAIDMDAVSMLAPDAKTGMSSSARTFSSRTWSSAGAAMDAMAIVRAAVSRSGGLVSNRQPRRLEMTRTGDDREFLAFLFLGRTDDASRLKNRTVAMAATHTRHLPMHGAQRNWQTVAQPCLSGAFACRAYGWGM